MFFRLNRIPDRTIPKPSPPSGIAPPVSRGRFAKDPTFENSSWRKSAGKPVPKPGSIRSSKGGRGR